MKFYQRLWIQVFCLLMICFCLSACNSSSGPEKKAQLVVSDFKPILRQTHENSYVVDVKGTIRNTGDVDVKKVVVTGYCKSCVLEFTSHRWFISDYEKTENQKDTISYLAAGASAEFSFEEAAFYLTHKKTPPENLPEKIEVVIESYETVE